MLLSWQKLSGLAWWSRASVLQGLQAITQPLCWTAQKAVNVGTFVDIKSPAAQVKWSVNSANKLNTVSEIRCCKMFNNLLFSVIKDPSRGLPGLNTRRRFPWRQRYKRGARMKPPCPRCVWSRSTPNTPNSSTTCGWWSESHLCSFASSGSRATCVWAPQPSEPSSGTNSSCFCQRQYWNFCLLWCFFFNAQNYKSSRSLFGTYRPAPLLVVTVFCSACHGT